MCQVQSNMRLLAKACIRCAFPDSTNNNITRSIYNSIVTARAAFFSCFFSQRNEDSNHSQLLCFLSFAFYISFVSLSPIYIYRLQCCCCVYTYTSDLIDCKFWNCFSFVVFSVFLPIYSKPLIVSA